MADNYLEKKMEDIRTGRTSKQSLSHRQTIGISYSNYTGLSVMIIGGASRLGVQLAKDFRAKGASVDILDSDWNQGQLAAQESGARFYPTDISDPKDIELKRRKIIDARGKIDISISL